MWMLSFISDDILLYVINSILILGAVLSFLSFFVLHRLVRWFPWITPYHLLLQIVSAVLLVTGIYFKGGYSVEVEWREKVRQAEERVKIAEELSKEANVQIKTQIVEKIKVVKDVQVVIQDRIVEKEKLINSECKVSPEAVVIINDAAKNTKGAK
jgi:preprotein translocase subunit SecF